MRRATSCVMLIASVVLAVGCGNKTTAATTTRPAAAATTVTTKSTGGTTTTGAATSSTETNFSGAGGARYCELSRKYQDASKQLSSNSPDDVKKEIELIKAAIKEVAGVVPPEIRADWELLLPAILEFIKAIEDAGYDYQKLDSSKVEKMSTPEVQQASDRINAYDTQVCKSSG